MFKLVFLFVVLIAIAVAFANPHPGQTKAKKASALKKHSVHHDLDSHGPARPATRVARSHGARTSVHHAPGGSAHHYNKVGAAHGIHGGNHGIHGAGNKAVVHRPVKHRGHRK